MGICWFFFKKPLSRARVVPPPLVSSPQSYRGYKYYQQLTRTFKRPTFGLTQSYADYIRSLPPVERIDEAESAVRWLNESQPDFPRDISYVLERPKHGPPYSTHTHTTYYY